ncbi:uncharacterized protein LOC126846364 [Adelges cooleyi]|uniref:uncharacterized protein LOC126846364 n=1 Tax=Adelges cooleyi TaxID=133065 RepID=UPI00217F3449|nr:uncharacterized protein LOC126846364 [Adelges cooleyi]
MSTGRLVAAWALLTATTVVVAAALPRDAANEDLMKASPLTVAQCRAGCLHKLVPSEMESTDCENRPDCWKCWKYCEVLQTEGKNMKNICEHKCDAGCQEACSFHDWHSSSQPSPVVEARGERALTVEAGTLRWPKPTDSSSPRLVYVIMRRREPGTRRTWSQLGQTPGFKARLPKTTVPCTVRVLAVSAEGLVTIYSPATADATPAASSTETDSAAAAPSPLAPAPAAGLALHDLRDADVIIRSLGRDQILGIRLPLAARSESQDESLRLMGDDPPADSSEVWNLREVSMIHQKVLVIAEVAWDARQVRRPAYLVTWEIVGGGLKGNLFTDTTCVTLSLWPDTAYLIQVSLLGGADDSVKMSSSPTLLLDTRSAVHSTTAAVPVPVTETTTPEAAMAKTFDNGSDSWSDEITGEDVTAELSAPEAPAVLGHTEWQMMTAAGLGVALFLLMAVALVSCRTPSPATLKADPECPPLLDYPPKSSYDFTKYLGRCRKSHHRLLVDDPLPPPHHSPAQVMHVRH